MNCYTHLNDIQTDIFMKRILLLLIVFTAVVNNTAAQSFTFSMDKLAPMRVDARRFLQEFGQSDYSTSARIMTRGTVNTTDGLKWIDRIHNLPDYMRDYYDRFGALVEEAMSGTDNALVRVNDYDILVIGTFHINRLVTIPQNEDYNSRNVVLKYANAALEQLIDSLSEEVNPFLTYMNACMNNDNNCFWYSGVLYTSFSATYNASMVKPYVYSVSYTILFNHVLREDESDYDYRLAGFRDEASLRAGITEYKSLIESIVAHAPSTSRYDQVRYLNNWLTVNNAYSYGYAEYGKDLCWSSISALRGTYGPSGPVCEGYSRAMKALCDALDIPCMLAVGNAISHVQDTPEGHMWNEIQMDNGKWYAVDVTWNDPVDPSRRLVCNSGLECEDWLLLGKNDIVAPGLTFIQSHMSQPASDLSMADAQYWDYSFESPIEKSKYDHVSSVQASVQPKTVNAYSIIGVNLGSFRSIDEAVSSLEPGIYIIGGRKVTVY